MTSRQRIRVGRDVTYRPTDAEAAAGNGNSGDEWAATITGVSADGSANLSVHEADGGFIALTSVPRGQTKGSIDSYGQASAS